MWIKRFSLTNKNDNKKSIIRTKDKSEENDYFFIRCLEEDDENFGDYNNSYDYDDVDDPRINNLQEDKIYGNMLLSPSTLNKDTLTSHALIMQVPELVTGKRKYCDTDDAKLFDTKDVRQRSCFVNDSTTTKRTSLDSNDLLSVKSSEPSLLSASSCLNDSGSLTIEDEICRDILPHSSSKQNPLFEFLRNGNSSKNINNDTVTIQSPPLSPTCNDISDGEQQTTQDELLRQALERSGKKSPYQNNSKPKLKALLYGGKNNSGSLSPPPLYAEKRDRISTNDSDSSCSGSRTTATMNTSSHELSIASNDGTTGNVTVTNNEDDPVLLNDKPSSQQKQKDDFCMSNFEFVDLQDNSSSNDSDSDNDDDNNNNNDSLSTASSRNVDGLSTDTCLDIFPGAIQPVEEEQGTPRKDNSLSDCPENLSILDEVDSDNNNDKDNNNDNDSDDKNEETPPTTTSTEDKVIMKTQDELLRISVQKLNEQKKLSRRSGLAKIKNWFHSS